MLYLSLCKPNLDRALGVSSDVLKAQMRIQRVGAEGSHSSLENTDRLVTLSGFVGSGCFANSHPLLGLRCDSVSLLAANVP